ncbi:MAG: MHYT domain-containing protein [Gemmatimonadaceae bacterium]
MNSASHSTLMTGSHNPLFVVLSVVIAILASYAALDLAGRVRSAEGSTRLGWLAGGATVMGLGIWSMHFVAMLAFHLPIPIAYQLTQMLLSVAVAIGASLLALVVVSRASLRPATLVFGGVLMGGAIAGMHYIGMASMQVGANLTYRAPIVVLSVVIAMVASLAALTLAFSFRSDVSARGRLLKSLSAIVMGFAIAGMHYTAMAAVRFVPRDIAAASGEHILATGTLAAAVVIGTLAILVLAIVGAVIDRNIQSRAEFTRQLASKAHKLAEQFDELQALTAKLEVMNGDLQRSLADAERARNDLAKEHEANLELQRVAQQQVVKSRFLEGVAETTTAVAHEINNPLTVLLMNAELLEDVGPGQAPGAIAEMRAAAVRIAAVVQRLTNLGSPRSVEYVGAKRMIDLSSEEG